LAILNAGGMIQEMAESKKADVIIRPHPWGLSFHPDTWKIGIDQ